MKQREKILIWDYPADLHLQKKSYKHVFLWSQLLSDKSDAISIPALVEYNSDLLKKKYLSWVYDLGNVSINKKSIIEHLELGDDFSYWWMTLISHKPNFYQAPQINAVIKLLALNSEYGDEIRKCDLVVYTNDKALAKVFKVFSKQQGNKCYVNSTNNSATTLITPALLLCFYAIIRALLFIGKTILSVAFRQRKQFTRFNNSKIVFFDILIHLDDKSFFTAKFKSNYWGEIVATLNWMSVKTMWVHKYYQHKKVESFKIARKLVKSFSHSSKDRERHILVDDYLDLKSVIVCFRRYFNFILIFIYTYKIKNFFVIDESEFDLWPLYRSNWIESLIGSMAFANYLSLQSYEILLKKMPPMDFGIYIQENQPWEMALIKAWNNSGHGKLIGVPHTTVRYWDLRYFYDPRTYENQPTNALPRPNIVALNGKNAKKQYTHYDYPSIELKEVEALRYLHLGKRKTKQHNSSNILICGDNIPESNEKLMLLIEQVSRKLLGSENFLFKPHPARSFDIGIYDIKNIMVTELDISELMDSSKMLICSNATSAAVDAFYKGLLVATFYDGSNLNTSPLRGLQQSLFFKDAEELYCIIKHNSSTVKTSLKPPSDFFYMGNDLLRWKKLLQLDT